MPAVRKKASPNQSTQEVDRLLSSVGLKHGTRKTRTPKARAARQRAEKSAAKSKPKGARRSTAAVTVLRAPLLDEVSEYIRHGFSLRPGGKSSVYGEPSLNLGFTAADSKTHVGANRKIFLGLVTGQSKVGKAPELVCLQQIHSDLIHVLKKKPSGKKLLSGDGFITNVSGVMLAIQTADCIPVLLADPNRKVVGAFHAGWRGTVRRIVEKGVGRMSLEFGSDPADILAAIGPGIHSCCYAVGDEVINEFGSQFSYAKELFSEVHDLDPIKEKYPLLFLTARAPGHSNLGPQTHLDLTEANRRQLLDAGVPAENIWTSDLCTSCRTDLLFSHRAEHGFTGRMMSAIGIISEKSSASKKRKNSRR